MSRYARFNSSPRSRRSGACFENRDGRAVRLSDGDVARAAELDAVTVIGAAEFRFSSLDAVDDGHLGGVRPIDLPPTANYDRLTHLQLRPVSLPQSEVHEESRVGIWQHRGLEDDPLSE